MVCPRGALAGRMRDEKGQCPHLTPSISAGECGGSTRGCFQPLAALRHLLPAVGTSPIEGEPGLSHVPPSATSLTPADPFWGTRAR